MSDRNDLTVEDVVAINQLMSLYAHAADSAKFNPPGSEPQQLLDQVFTPDAVFDAVSCGADDAWRGLDEIKQMFSLPKPLHPPTHHSTNVYAFRDGNTVRAKSKWIVSDWDKGSVRVGDYLDVVVRQDDGWRIAERVVVLRFGSFEYPE